MKAIMPERIDRFEVIDADGGHVYIAEGVSITFEYQDAGRTLKAIVTPAEPVVRKAGWISRLLRSTP